MNWKKIALWTFAVVASAVGLVLVAVLAVKHIPAVRRGILARAERYITESSGAQVEIRDFTLAVSNLSVQFEGIVARRPGPPTAPPLLQIERVAAELKIDSVFKRQWHLQDLVVQHPVVHVSVDRAGNSNLPTPKAGGGSGIATIFDLAIQRCRIENGEIYFNDAKSRLEAEVYNLRLNAELDRARDRYHGVLRYGQGKIQYAAYEPVVHDLDADFTLTRSQLSLDRLAVKSGRSQIVAQGTIANFGSPTVQAVYDAQLWGGDLRRDLNTATLPEGMVHANGSLNYTSRNDRPWLQSILLAGELSSSVVQVKTRAGPTDVRDLSATYKLEGGNAEIQNIRAHALGGSVNGSLSIRDLAGASRARLQARLQSVSLEQLEAKAPQYSLPEAHLRGKVSADLEANWGQTLADLVARADATMEGALGQAPSAPLSAAVHLGYDAARHEIDLRQSYFHTPATSVTLDGKVSRYSTLQVSAHSSDLHELELLASSLRTAFSGEPAPKLDLHGAAAFKGSITGLVTAPQIQGKLEAHNLQLKGSSWKLLRANVDAGPSAISLSSGYLESSTQGKINFSLRAGLDEWGYTPASPVSVDISVAQIPLGDVERLANQTFPVSGMISGSASIHGSQINPVGRGEISLTGGKILSEPVQNLTFRFEGNGDAVHANLVLRLFAGTAQAEVTLNPKTREYRTQIQADNIRLEHLQAVKQRKLSIVGSLSLDAAGHGIISSPELTANIKVSQLRIQEQAIQGLTLAVGIHERVAEVKLNSEFAQTPLEGHGTVEIKPPYMADLHLDTPRFSLQPLLRLYAPTYDGEVRGQTELHASLRGPLQNETLLEGHLDVPVLTASYQQFELGAAKPISLDYRNGVLTLQPAVLQGTGTHMQLQATIPVIDLSTASYLVEGTVDLGLAQLLQPGLRGSGQIRIDLDSRRHVAGSDVIGELRIVNAGLSGAEVPLGLDNGNGVVTVSPSRLEVKNFQGQVGGGAVTVRGGVTLRPAIRFELALSGNEIRLRYPEGVRMLLDPKLTLAGNRQSATLSGAVIVDRVSLTPDFDLTSLINQFANEETLVSSGGFAQHVRLDVALQSASQVDAISTKVSLRGNADLRLTGTAAEPVILGRANLNGGDLFLGGNRFLVQSGAIDFVNPLRTEAVLNAQVTTKIDQYDITLNIQGPTERLKTSYTSEPPLPPADIINLLAFGHTSEGGNPVASGNLGAQSALVQGLGSAVSSRVQKFAGLSYFSIDPTLGGSNQNAGARVVIQERVTSNLVVTYSTDVTSTQRQSIQLEYRFNPRWSVSGVRDQNGGLGATASFHKTF
ncbi:MAG TPA: translocation/assembly module TamB domain-containing protein [Candidatus Angelobacter sp.]